MKFSLEIREKDMEFYDKELWQLSYMTTSD